MKAGGTQQTVACCELKADRRWCCSGTPISTDVRYGVDTHLFTMWSAESADKSHEENELSDPVIRRGTVLQRVCGSVQVPGLPTLRQQELLRLPCKPGHLVMTWLHQLSVCKLLGCFQSQRQMLTSNVLLSA